MFSGINVFLLGIRNFMWGSTMGLEFDMSGKLEVLSFWLKMA